MPYRRSAAPGSGEAARAVVVAGKHRAPPFEVGSLILTYRCPVACPMCFLGCGPQRSERIPEELASRAIDELAREDVGFVGLAGGEPLLEEALLLRLAKRATEHGLTAILVTNAYWAVSEAATLRILESLRESGISWIQISLDDQHQRMIPIERVANALKGASKLRFADIKLLGASKGNSERFKYQVFYLQEVLGVDVEKVDLLDRPRVSHARFHDPEQVRYSIDELEEGQRFKPPECLTELMIDVDGSVYPCCNNFIGSVGNLAVSTLRDLLNGLRRNVCFRVLAERGVPALARVLDVSCGGRICSGRYESWCSLCARIFQSERFCRLLMEPELAQRVIPRESYLVAYNR